MRFERTRWLAGLALVLSACGSGSETTANAETGGSGEPTVEAASAQGGSPAAVAAPGKMAKDDRPAAPAKMAKDDRPSAPAKMAKDDRPAAPDFELLDLAGNPVKMSGLRGKTVVVDFWATWCPPCIFQIPILNAIQAKHGGDGVVVLGVAVDAEGAEVVRPYAQENDIQYTVLIGDESLARKFGAPGFPALAIVSPEGRIDSMHVGLIEEADLDAAITKIQGS